MTIVCTLDTALDEAKKLKYPIVIKPAYGLCSKDEFPQIVYNNEEFETVVNRALAVSLISEISLEEMK
jgi:carbamoylphosphate synthase large subunit